MSAVSVEAVSKAMGALLEREGRTVIYQDRASGEDLAVTPASAAAPNGLLPALVVAGEAVWREATGHGFALDIVRDPAALLGYRLRAIRDGQFSTVMLATMEAAAQVAQPGAIVVNDLGALWSAAVQGLERRVAVTPASPGGASP